MGVQCMSWLTPLPQQNWKSRYAIGSEMPKELFFCKGCIHDTARTATLSALLTAREKAINYEINENSFSNGEVFRVYSSAHVHSSIDKALKIAGIGAANLVRIPVDKNFTMIPEALEQVIRADLENGFRSLCVISA